MVMKLLQDGLVPMDAMLGDYWGCQHIAFGACWCQGGFEQHAASKYIIKKGIVRVNIKCG